MTIQSDVWIERQCTLTETLQKELELMYSGADRLYQKASIELNAERDGWKGPMIEPFSPKSIRTRRETLQFDDPHLTLEQLENEYGLTKQELDQRILSWGLSSFGYDVRLDRDFRIFTNVNSKIIDPHNFDEGCYVRHLGDEVIIPPNGFILGLTVEYIRVPRDVLVICLGKSTLARCGAIVNVTPLEPEWEGKVVIEISNTTSLPLKIYANEGVAQFLFLKGDRACRTSYADRLGKYQGQRELVVAKV